MPSRVLRTARLVLEPWAQRDVDALHALLVEADVRRYLCDDEIIPRERVLEYFAASDATFAGRRFGLWTVRRHGETSLVGFCGLREFDGGREVELLYALASPHWHQGLATEAARAVLHHGLTEAKLPRIWARTDPPNEASVRVMQRAGMRSVERPPAGSEGYVCFVLAAP